MALFGPISTGMNFSTFNQQRKLEQQMKALGAFPWQAQRFSPYPAVAPAHFEEIANLKEKLHQSQMRENDTQIAFLKYQMQQQAMLTQQCLDSMKFLQNTHGQTSSQMQTITYTQTQTKTTNLMKND